MTGRCRSQGVIEWDGVISYDEGVTNLPGPLANTRRPCGRRVSYCLWGRFVLGAFQAGQKIFDRINVEIGKGKRIIP